MLKGDRDPVPPRGSQTSHAADPDGSLGATFGNNPLVPRDDAASRSLVAVVAILTFLAGLAAGGGALVAGASRAWQGEIAREATIQVRPATGRDLDADVARAAAIASAFPGIAAARPLSKAESEDLLAPWLGRGLDLADLPVPRLVALRFTGVAGERPDLAGLRARLASALDVATLDDHGGWQTRLAATANTVVAGAAGLVVLVLGAAGGAVAFATRGAMAGNRDLVDVLHFVGAGQAFIARQFQLRFARLGLRGGLIGGVAAALAFAGADLVGRADVAGPSWLGVGAVLGGFGPGLLGYGLIAGIAVLVGAIAGLVSGRTVRRYLSESRGV